MESILKLKELLPCRKVEIEYRTHDIFGDDILHGACKWDGNVLKPIDNDIYSIEDEISSYEWNGPNNLTVWYISKWVTG